MNENEKTPVLEETFLETFSDLIKPIDELVNDELAEDKSDYILRVYNNSCGKKKEGMDFLSICLTGKNIPAIIEENKKINESNKNVG